jgi:transcriptional regulator with XRE-family HTH domain
MIGEAITFFREERKLTQQELGEMVGMSQKTISTIETNQREVSDEEIKRFSQALRVPENLLYAHKGVVQNVHINTVERDSINAHTYVHGKEELVTEIIESDKRQISFLQEMVTKLNDTLSKVLSKGE